MSLRTSRYRSLREETVHFGDLNLFIGANGSGKSTILDALRFLRDGAVEGSFRPPVMSRGGMRHLAWNGEDASGIELSVQVDEGDDTYAWNVRLEKNGHDILVKEEVHQSRSGDSPVQLLSADSGRGWWSSSAGNGRVTLSQSPTTCALAAAAADASFPARRVAEFVGGWGFFDPDSFLLRRDSTGLDSTGLDAYGRNLAETLYFLSKSQPESFLQIVAATNAVLGLPSGIEPRESEDRFYFVQYERGLEHPVHQVGVSSGTLRVLALMTALFGATERNLIGIEEPENHVHPAALASCAEYLLKARHRVQVLVTTHSPILLDCINEPEAVSVVRYSTSDGTRVTSESDGKAVQEALEASGFGLGEFYETKGFGG